MTKIKQWRKKLSVKKALLSLLCILLCLIPTILASFYVYYRDFSYHTDHFSVTLYDQNGKELVAQSGNPENATPGSILDIFYQLDTKKTPLPKTSGSPNDDIFIIAKCSLNGTPSELKCYFSRFQPQGYCIDPMEKVYAIPEKINEVFLLSSYGELFYTNAILPALTTLDGDRILPQANEWYYQAIDGQFFKAIKNETTSAQSFYEISGALGIQFDLPPDHCIVSIYHNGTLLQKSSLEQLSSVAVSVGSRLMLEIDASWAQSPEASYFGSAHYQFEVEIRNPSSFMLRQTTVAKGEILLLSGTNVSDLAKIKCSLNEKPVVPFFVQEGSMAYGILPISKDLAGSEALLQISYGASAQSFQITLTTSEPAPLAKPDWDASSGSVDSLQEFQYILSSIPSPQSLPRYFRGNFRDPLSDGFEIEYQHGTVVLCGEEELPWIACGTEYVTDRNSDVAVVSQNHGVVSYVGNSKIFGSFVIIDHGCGIRTIYGALSNVMVEVGEIVQQGQAIAKTSHDTRSGKNGFLLLCSVGTTPIDPSVLQKNSLTFPS